MSNIVCIYIGRKFLREKPAWRAGFNICWSGPANGMKSGLVMGEAVALNVVLLAEIIL